MDTPEQVAKLVENGLKEKDARLLRYLDIDEMHIEPDRATLALTVTRDMLNSGNVCQGGILYTLADQAMAYACLSDNQAGLTLSGDMVYNAAAHEGDRITANARVTTKGGRIFTCDSEVHNQDGVLLAQFRGIWYRMREVVISVQ